MIATFTPLVLGASLLQGEASVSRTALALSSSQAGPVSNSISVHVPRQSTPLVGSPPEFLWPRTSSPLPGRALIRLDELPEIGDGVEIDPEGLAASGWVTVRSAGEGAPDLDWRTFAARPGVSFASPLLRDAKGDVRAATSRLIVRFDASIDLSVTPAWLAELGAVEMLEIDAFGLPGTVLLETGTDDGGVVWTLAERIAAHPTVRFAEPHCLLSAEPHGGDGSLIADCWGLANTGEDLDFCGQAGGIAGLDMRAEFAWETTFGDAGVVIVILDNGIEFDHPDLQASELGFDPTGDDAGGWPVTSCDNHGTAVAGCVAATSDDYGVAGLAPGTTIASARISTVSPSCNTWTVDPIWIAEALAWSVSIGARITNTSWRFAESALIAEAYTATAEAGLLHVASAGNGGAAEVDFPASLDSVVAVGAMTRWGSTASFSNRGGDLEFVAPGQVVVCPDRVGEVGYRFGEFACLDGTSFASPFVAGVAGLMVSENPTLQPAQVRTLLRTAVRDLGAVGWDATHGWGLPRADLAIAAATKPADLDRNGIVHATDLAMMLAMWGLEGPLGDLDGDGVVGAADLAMLLAMWDG